ncbi:MAG TPA: pitrilysin family protein [Bacteroidales bacterium]|nr:pitrilysin family protein [Bacteroidales bacterium]
MPTNEYFIHTLKNGIRLIHKPANSPVSHMGLFINTGSRDEYENEHGMAHLIEHMLFKGTEHRKSYHILSRLEDVGGELNAYTTKEETCIHATFFDEYYARALDLISDIAFNSSFPEKELKKEKEIILDEINSYKDSPSELIFDEFEELLFDGNPIGRNILGSEEGLKKYTPSDIRKFINRNYTTDQMVVSSVGNIPFGKLVKLFERYFNVPELKAAGTRKQVTYANNPVTRRIDRKTHQAHCIIGNLAYPIHDCRRLPLYVLNNYLGGPGSNSLLNMSLRERRGYAYTIDSMYTSYNDTGNVTIYFGTDKTLVDKCIDIVLRELRLFKSKKLSTIQLHKAKRQVLGHIAISSENNENYMLSMGKSLLIFNKIETLGETGRKIQAIRAEELTDIANEILDENRLSYLIYL